MSVFADLLQDAGRRGGAVGAFTCYDFESALGVVEAAEAAGRGAIILIPPSHFRSERGKHLALALCSLRAAARVPLALQLDHVSDLELVESAFALGVDAVMADGSKLPFAENLELTRRACEVAAHFGGAIEAELGHVEGDEDLAITTSATSLTDAAAAARFAKSANVQLLAIAIGNVHGLYSAPPTLDFSRLAEISNRVKVPLSLHGASGLPENDLRRSIELGIRKVNVNTELRQAYVAATGAALSRIEAGADVASLHREQIEAVRAVVAKKLEILARTER